MRSPPAITSMENKHDKNKLMSVLNNVFLPLEGVMNVRQKRCQAASDNIQHRSGLKGYILSL